MGRVFFVCQMEREMFLRKLIKERIPYLEEEIYQCQKGEVERAVSKVLQIQGVVGFAKLHTLDISKVISLEARKSTYPYLDKIRDLYGRFFLVYQIPISNRSFALTDFSSQGASPLCKEEDPRPLVCFSSFEDLLLDWWEKSVVQPEIVAIRKKLAFYDPWKEFLLDQSIRRYLFP